MRNNFKIYNTISIQKYNIYNNVINLYFFKYLVCLVKCQFFFAK